MSILDSQRYVENMTRKEIADALKKGHPLVPGFLLADRAKQLQQNDALLKVLEEQAGLPAPGTSIVDKLEAYLRNPNPAQQQPGQPQPPGGPQAGPPGGPPGGPRPPGPGPMPQGGPPGAGGPMPGPQAPGGAGGPMPGMPQGPPGAGGAPMRSGGIIGFQTGGSPEQEYGYEWDRWSGPDPDVPEHSIWPGFGRGFMRNIGAPAYGAFQKGAHNLARLHEALFWGQQYGPEKRGPEGQLLMEHLIGKGRYDPTESGWSGFKRRVPIESSAEEAAGGGGTTGITGTRRPARGMMDDFNERLAEMRSELTAPTQAELTAEKIDQEYIRSRKRERSGLASAAELESRSDALIAVSEFLGRRGHPDQLTMGGVGALMKAGQDERRGERADLDELIYGAESGLAGAQAARSRAGQALYETELEAMLAKIAHEASLREARLGAQGSGLFSDASDWEAILDAIDRVEDDEQAEMMRQEAWARMQAEISRGQSVSPDLISRLLGGGVNTAPI